MKENNSFFELDCSSYEDSDSLLQLAISLSATIKKPCRIFNISKEREKSGLITQHLLAIQALAQLTKGKLEGDELYSKEIKFWPGQDYQEMVSVKIETAISIPLILQSLILPAFFASKPIKISFDGGATDTFFAPTIDYFRYVFLKILEKMTTKVELNILKRGYWPQGKAKVEVTTYPSKFKALNLVEKGQFLEILAISGASDILKDKKVAERQLAGTREVLGKLNLKTEERVEYYQTQGPGSQIFLMAKFENTFLGTDEVGKLGKRSEDLGKETALELLKEQKSGACLDSYLTDQILPYLALANNQSQVTVSKITNHCQNKMWLIEKFLNGKFEINNNLISWNPN